MQDVKRQIRELRPSLKLVAPLTWSIILGFSVLNIILGASLLFYTFSTPIAIVTPYTPIWVYSFIFIGLGLINLTALRLNSWKSLRVLLVIGMLFKSIWLFALVLRLFTGGSAIILTLWLFLTYIQAMTYIYFIPAPRGVFNGSN